MAKDSNRYSQLIEGVFFKNHKRGAQEVRAPLKIRGALEVCGCPNQNKRSV